MEFRDYAPLELLAEADALDRLRGDIVGVGLKADTHYLRDVWFQSGDGRWLALIPNQRDLEFKFEVFGLCLATPAGLAARMRKMGWRAPEPAPPETFEPWPLTAPWRVQVLRRAEYIVEDLVIEGALGENPIAQSAAPPGDIPDNASAQCEVAVGLLFTGADGARRVAGVDWFPETLVFLRDEGEIDQYVARCEAVDLANYQPDAWNN